MFKIKTSYIITFLFLLSACSNAVPRNPETSVVLNKNNYKIVKAAARGQSSGFYLLGLIPIMTPNYASAKADLYDSIGQSLEGRSIALANQSQDRSTFYLFLFSVPTISITADVVEFHEEQSTRLSLD
jgi:hypothetical protein